MEWLDLVSNDSENLERTMRCMTDDCLWIMEPGGSEYRGSEQIRAFVRIAMSGRTHDSGEHRLLLTNWFADSENLCYEYTHGMILTGNFTAGIKGRAKTGVLRYCITCHLRDGKVDEVHEYIDSTSWWIGLVLRLALSNLYRLTMKALAKERSRA